MPTRHRRTIGAGTLVPEGDGYRFNGRWGFCSGCQGATWVGGRAALPLAEGQEAPDALWALVPIERARIEETWDVVGMIGTGSHTVVVEQQHIPAAWTFRHTRLGPRDYGPIVRRGRQQHLADRDRCGRGATWHIAKDARCRGGVRASQARTPGRRAADRERTCAAPGDARGGRLVGGPRRCRTGADQVVAGCWREPPAAIDTSRAADRQCPRLDDGDSKSSGPSANRRHVRRTCRWDFAACLMDARTLGSHVGVAGTSSNWRRGCGSACLKTVS